jgi:probable HAF family extracellular repeat protein
MVGIGDLPGGSFNSIANGISADGTIVVGQGVTDLGSEAFRWTSGDGLVSLGDLPGGDVLTFATGISDDGNVIVGQGRSAVGDEAFRWTSGGGMVGLGDLPGGSFDSRANAASSDGSVIVGQGTSAVGDEAFVWTSSWGMVSIRDVLIAHDIDLTGWTLTTATGVSDDGLTFVGTGTNPSGNTEAWIATIPEPSSLVLAALGLSCVALARKRTRTRDVDSGRRDLSSDPARMR